MEESKSLTLKRHLKLLVIISPQKVDQKIAESMMASLQDTENIEINQIKFEDLAKKDSEPAYKDIEVVVGFNSKDCIKKAMELCPNMKWYHNIWTGSENVLKHQPFYDSDILLTNTKGASTIPLSEFVFASAIYFTKKFPFFIARQREGVWEKTNVENVTGKTVLVVG